MGAALLPVALGRQHPADDDSHSRAGQGTEYEVPNTLPSTGDCCEGDSEGRSHGPPEGVFHPDESRPSTRTGIRQEGLVPDSRAAQVPLVEKGKSGAGTSLWKRTEVVWHKLRSAIRMTTSDRPQVLR